MYSNYRQITWVLLMYGLVLASCQSGAPDSMTSLEKEVADAPTTDNVTALLERYDAWLYEHPEPSKAQQEVLEKSLAVSQQHKRFTHALGTLQRLVIDYHSNPHTKDRILLTGDLLTKTGKTAAADVLYVAFMEKYPDHPLPGEIKDQFASKPNLDALISDIGRRIFSDTTQTLNESAARQFVDACEAYALVYHGSDQATEFLHKAAETARTLHSTAKSMTLYDWIIRTNPNHKRAAQALFLKGFTYDNDLNDQEAARSTYEEFLKKYPNDEFAESAKFLLENLGKSDDELLESLQKRAAQNATDKE